LKPTLKAILGKPSGICHRILLNLLLLRAGMRFNSRLFGKESPARDSRNASQSVTVSYRTDLVAQSRFAVPEPFYGQF
jgi:hypothetical protein